MSEFRYAGQTRFGKPVFDKPTVVRRKVCECREATASGPRIVLRKERVPEGLRIWSEFIEFACDLCDTPWERIR